MAESISRVLQQPKQRPTLANLKRVCPQDLAHCEGYVWHLGSRIGKGSFGDVYLGWSSDGTKEVAVKVVRKDFFKQDPKVRENLDREIKILKLLRGYEYVVHLYHVQELKQHIVLVMELCEFDLDHLVKIKPFKEQDIIIFLHQLAQGMKALREQNIVHRDLKPGNILIKRHPTTGKMMIKLADFGFARHFKDEGTMKHIDMTSLAGTPVFMAPEALDCVFHTGKHYDDKVDIWSIGALLYKVIVGQCGFYAELQHIPRILRHKGDAIAFERVRGTKVNYISVLPPAVNNRLLEPFREKMNKLLRLMLKLDPAERMTFSEFYATVEDMMTSKIEIIHLLHGTSMKVMNDEQLTAESLAQEIHSCTHVPPEHQVLFSNSSQYFISPHSTLSPEHFSQLLEESGGTRGHAKLYLLPINLVESDTLTPDYNCLAGIGFVIEDKDWCVLQIVDHKFSDEMVHMIHNMRAQQKSQLEGLDELCTFVSREVTLFGSHGYKQLSEMGHQALAKANLAIQWLQQDLSSLPNKNQGQLGAHLQTVKQQKEIIEKLVQNLDGFNSAAEISVSTGLKKEDLTTTANVLAQDSKKLPKIRKDSIHASCVNINDDCQKLVAEVTGKVKGQLQPLWARLSQVWTLNQTLENLRKTSAGLETVLEQVSMERETMLRSSLGLSVPAKLAQGGVVTPSPLLATAPSPSWNSGPLPVPPSHKTWDTSPSVEAIKRENEELHSQVNRLTSELSTLKIASSSEVDHAEEQTITSEAVDQLRPHSSTDVESTMKISSLSEESVKTLEELAKQLKEFCSTTERLKLGATGHKEGGTTLFPSLLEGYSVITMAEAPTDSSDSPPVNLDTLLPRALELAELVKANKESILQSSATATISPNSGLVKIARPSEYEEGDIVMFHQVKLIKSKRAVPVVLHLEKPRPYILMDESCFGHFNIQHRKMADLILGRLKEKPHKLNFEDHPDLADDFGCPRGDFFKVKAETTVLKFSAPRSGPSRQRPPTADAADKKNGSSGGSRLGGKPPPKGFV